METSKIYTGRRKIYTSQEPILQNIPNILNNAMYTHNLNRSECDYLINYTLGKQPILNRTKIVREEIKNNTVFNFAFSFIRTIIGYTFGQPIQYISRKTDKQASIEQLNDYMDDENAHTADTEAAWYASICGIGYKCGLSDEDDVPFNISSLDPRNTFVVLSTEMNEKPILTCSYVNELDINGNPLYTVYTVYTNDITLKYRTPVDGQISADSLIKGSYKPNALKTNPIVAYYNNQFLIGDVEMALTVFDAINTIGSNSIDDVEQIVQSILVLIGVDTENSEKVKELNSGSVLTLPGNQGVNQDAKFINAALDAAGVASLREWLEEAVRSIVGIPDRKTRGGGGGDTGDAVKLRDGWADLEIVARNKEMFWKKSEKKLLKAVLNILHINQKCKDLTPLDIDIKFTRNKNDNLITKTQAMATMYNMGMAKQDILAAGEITTDNMEVEKRWIIAEKEKNANDSNNSVITDDFGTSV